MLKLSFRTPAILLLIPLLSLLFSCTSQKEEKLQVKAKVKQNLVTATISDPKTFNILISKETSSSDVVSPLFEGLVSLNPKTLEHEPMLAESWEFSEGGKRWTFHLRKGVKWHDGEPFTADDIIFTFKAIYDPKVPTSTRDILSIEGKPFTLEKVDEMTVRFILPKPFAPFLNSIGAADIMPEHILGKALEEGHFADNWGIDTPPEKLIGTGPYIMTKYVPAQYVKYKRNPNYWMKDEGGKQLPYLEEQNLLIVPDQNTLYVKFTAGQTDTHGPRPEEVETLKKDAKKLDITVKKRGLNTGTLFVTFNRNPEYFLKNNEANPRYKWFRDKHFLRGLAHAVDKETIIANTMFGRGKASVAEISEENKLFHNPDLKDYKYDLEKALQVLSEGGYKKGEDGLLRDSDSNIIEFDLNTNAGNHLREQICSILQEDWQKLGIKVNYRPLEFNLLVEKLDNTYQWDAILIGFTAGIEPHNGASLHRSSGHLHMWHPKQKKPASAWEAEIDRLIEAGASEMDTEKRKKIYYRLQEIYHEELPMIQMVRQEVYSAYKNKLLNYDPTVWGLYKSERIKIKE
ncbi:MAG: ABC transporter substrate-binding protein [Deltaproteobacteria bacterium]|nr:ABC transporter substrate-binding protein [Deltaproteobacteria bacterium]